MRARWRQVHPLIPRVTLMFGLVAVSFMNDASASSSIASRSNAKVVRLLNWWDYMAPEVAAKLRANGFDIHLTEYKTNEMAIARLASRSENYDVVILSNVVREAAGKELIEKRMFGNLFKQRKYEETFAGSNHDCVPYLWSTTAFTYDAQQGDRPPSTIAELADLKGRGYKVAIIDDLFEYSARLIADGIRPPNQCAARVEPANVLSLLNRCEPRQVLTSPSGISAEDFRSDIEEFLKQEKVAAYGWHGSLVVSASKNPNLKMVMGKKDPIIGFDAVCIVRNRGSAISLEELRRFVALLTDQSSTIANVRKTQYFSPYQGDRKELLSPALHLYDQVTDRLSRGPAYLIHSPSKDVHMKLNEWWRRLRYAK